MRIVLVVTVTETPTRVDPHTVADALLESTYTRQAEPVHSPSCITRLVGAEWWGNSAIEQLVGDVAGTVKWDESWEEIRQGLTGRV